MSGQTPAIDAAAELFVVGNEGLAFQERTQRLFVLNEGAMLVWCALQEGRSLEETKALLARAAELSPGQAAQVIEELLLNWRDLGLLLSDVQPAPSPRSREVKAAPQTIVSDESLLRQASVTELGIRLLGSRITISSSSPDVAAGVHACFGHLEDAGVCGRDVTFRVVHTDRGFVFLRNEEVLGFAPNVTAVIPTLKTMVGAYAINNADHFMLLHAGVIGDGTSCILLPGAAGSGKSTICAAMMHAGFELFSDEFAPLLETSLHVRSVPLALCLKSSGWDLLSELYPALDEASSHERLDGKIVRYLPPSSQSGSEGLDREAPVRAVVFPSYRNDAENALVALSPVEALGRLLDQCLVMQDWLDTAKVSRLVEWIKGVECWHLQTSSLDEAVNLLRGCFGGLGSPMPSWHTNLECRE